ncbi:MAG: flavin-containing monooxygenase [Actinomycetales bacterium]
MSRYCIIGAGAAGISALQQLREAGFEVDCFEKTARVGGHWHTDYDALHLITSRDMTHFDGFPMPASYPHFPRRDQVRSYIESYSAHHGHYDIIHFDTEVLSVSPAPGDGPIGSAGWHVVTSRGDEGIYDGVLVANGHLWDKSVPEVDGEFTGIQLHSSEYRNTTDLAGQRVLVVGAGNSGCDLAVDCAQHRFEVDVVMRKGIHFQPKTYFGVPRAELTWLSQFSPQEQDLINRLLARVSIGQNSDYPGMPMPRSQTLAGGATTVNDLLLYWVHHGRIGIRPGISRFSGTLVHFEDGTACEYDSILWATGFKVTLGFLDQHLITWRNQVPVRYAGGILPEGVEKLYFVGLIAPRGPQINIYAEQAALITQMLRLHEQAGAGGMALAGHFAAVQEPELRIDIVRAIWNDQMAHTLDVLQALASSSAQRVSETSTC